MTMMMIMGHECLWGSVWGGMERRGGKERILRGEEDGSMLHTYI
jgi:hypothetical protein